MRLVLPALLVTSLAMPPDAAADLVPPPGGVLQPAPSSDRAPSPPVPACDSSRWTRSHDRQLAQPLRQLGVKRGDNLIVGFSLERIAPVAALLGRGGITSGEPLARAALSCSGSQPGIQSPDVVAVRRVHDDRSGLDVELASFGSESMTRGWPGGRCGLRVWDPSQPSRFLDIRPSEVPASNQLTGILRDGEAVYLLFQFNGYAHEIGGDGNLVLAGDLCQHRTVWRSAALRSNAPALLAGEFLITGYGFTREPDWLYVFDRRTGREVQRLALPKSPEELRATSDRLFVRLYDGYATFAFKPPISVPPVAVRPSAIEPVPPPSVSAPPVPAQPGSVSAPAPRPEPVQANRCVRYRGTTVSPCGAAVGISGQPASVDAVACDGCVADNDCRDKPNGRCVLLGGRPCGNAASYVCRYAGDVCEGCPQCLNDGQGRAECRGVLRPAGKNAPNAR